ncbi:hypothetical protein [Streptomyces sp. NPDC003032]
MLTMRRAAVASTTALVLGLGTVPAIAQSQGHPEPDVASAQALAAQQVASAQGEVLSSIPWKKRGRHHVPKCARHGKKYVFKVNLHNKCRRAFTYHLKIGWGPDQCKTVPKGAKRNVELRGRLEKVTNGRSSGRC